MSGRRWCTALALVCVVAAPAFAAGDPLAAERQYRLARRLAAERSKDALAALRRVVELDPEGPLADDAHVEWALHVGTPVWPEDLGAIAQAEADAARASLDSAVGLRDADRADEARYYRALLQLEPLPGRDLPAARLELVAIATLRDPGEWPARARYAVALLDALGGDRERARAAWTRLVVDHPGSTVAVRSAVGLARLFLRDGHAGSAAAESQLAIEAGASAELGAEALRHASVRRVLNPGGLPGPDDAPQIVAPGTAIRSPTNLVALRDGGAVLGDRKAGEVVRFGGDGRVLSRWSVAGVTAVAADPSGRLYAADAGAVTVLGAEGALRRIGGLGDFAPASALAADGTGGIWVTDRKGTRVGRVDPAADQPIDIIDLTDARVVALAADAGKLLALDGKSGTVWGLAAGASPVRVFVGPERPASFAIVPGGRIAILDTRQSAVSFHEADGTLLGAWSTREAGLIKPVALAIGPEGSMHLFDGGNDAWWRSP